jgi:hypothetical protein
MPKVATVVVLSRDIALVLTNDDIGIGVRSVIHVLYDVEKLHISR